MSVYAVFDGGVFDKGTSTAELGVVLRLRDCRPSRPLGLLFMTAGGMLSNSSITHELVVEAGGRYVVGRRLYDVG